MTSPGARIAKLLEEAADPLDLSEIASELRIARVDALCAIRHLMDDGRVARVWRPDRRSRLGGEAPEAFMLRMPDDAHLARDTIVVTPTNREARILRSIGDGFVEFEYLDEPVKADARGFCKASLLLPFLPGRARPAPVRVA